MRPAPPLHRIAYSGEYADGPNPANPAKDQRDLPSDISHLSFHLPELCYMSGEVYSVLTEFQSGKSGILI